MGQPSDNHKELNSSDGHRVRERTPSLLREPAALAAVLGEPANLCLDSDPWQRGW